MVAQTLTSHAEDQDTALGPPARPTPRWALPVAYAAAIAVLAVLTVLRYTVPYLQADGVQQSVMSVQSVELFYWGQNRFAAFVSLMASPVADPMWNLALCLFINAAFFHGLLLVLARMGVNVLTGVRTWWATTVLFLVFEATTFAVIQGGALHIMSLESQPYSMSWCLVLLSFLLWKRNDWWASTLAAAFAWVAMGLNQTTVLGAAFLAVFEMFRRHQWKRWPLYGVVWVAWFSVWSVLSARYGGVSGPVPEAQPEYFAFDRTLFTANAVTSMSHIMATFIPTRAFVLLLLALIAAGVLAAHRRVVLWPRLMLGASFTVGYWVLFTGNPWVALNGYPFRYFFPVVIFVLVCLGAPLAAVFTGLRHPNILLRPIPRISELSGRLTANAALGVALLACVVALVGPLRTPAQAPVLTQTQATGQYALDHDVTFLGGYYWDMWPILHHALNGGRDAAFVTGYKSGGDPAAYRRAFERELAAGLPGPRAMCVNQPVALCLPYLEYWTKAKGWVETGETCPAPPADIPNILGNPPERACRILVYRGAGS